MTEVTEELSDKERELTAKLETAEQQLEAVAQQAQVAEARLAELTTKQRTAELYRQLEPILAEMKGLPSIGAVDPLTKAETGSEVYERFCDKSINRLQEQLTQFDQSLSVAQKAHNDIQAKLRRQQQQVNIIAQQLREERPSLRVKHFTLKDADGNEQIITVSYRANALLPWSGDPQEEKRFQRILRNSLIACLLLMLLIPFIPVPEPEVVEVIEVPPRIVKLLQERRPPPPPPPPPPPEVVEPEVQPTPQPRKDIQPKKVAPKPDNKKPQVAREKAARAGLFAFDDAFANLDNSADQKLGKQARVTSAGASAQQTERAIVTSNARSGSGGINTAALSRDVAGTGLSGRGTSRVSGVIGGDEFGDADQPVGSGFASGRTSEEIQLVFDRNKNALYGIYQRALRSNPTLRGEITLRLTILPNGQVSKVTVVASDLGDPTLEQKIATRVKLLRFEDKDVPTVTINYPIEFFPQ